ncbi:CaiB/BaiF CoA transferase family protein [Microlunatus speluncae]|uniref:CaiB/BaiF CoA transferase family protein n=1 Tax=Microlunatus speluncae TaxID=2594267 RepID=UPI001C2D64C7|nr:CoA transferase [Microlunatus speluncae]
MGTALEGIRVLDLTTVVFGPYASLILADYGAEVIKIESPAGDPVREAGPGAEERYAALFLGSNRNKRSVVLDLKRDAAREALLRLADGADVIMHSMRPHKMAALGLEPESVLARNPRLIFAELAGFGAGGPYRERPAYDDIVQGLSGAADLMRRQTGEARYLPTIIADKIGGLTAAHAILAALFQRERTGSGQLVEVPMFEAMTSFLLTEHFHARHFADQDENDHGRAAGYTRILSPWRRPYPTLDGHVCLMPYSDRHWSSFFVETGHPELAADPRLADLGARTRHVDELYGLIAGILATDTTEHWLELCRRLDLPAAPVNRLEDLEHDPHLAEVGFFVELTDATGSYRFPRSPVRLADSAVAPALPPRLGADTAAVLREAGLSEAEITAVRG